MAPFRHLLSPATEFVWTDELEEAFVASKDKISEMIQIGVFTFDLHLETDYSKDGMNFAAEDMQMREDFANLLS